MLEELFTFVLDLDLEATGLYSQTKKQLATAVRETADAGFDDQQQELARFALVAFLDEAVMRSSWTRKREWPLLQYQLFNTHCAGNSFFEKLARIDKDNDPQLLEIYQRCLGLNYQGRLGVLSSDERHRQLEAIVSELNARTETPPLAPNGGPRSFGSSDPTGKPWWVWMGVIVLILMLVLLVVIFIVP